MEVRSVFERYDVDGSGTIEMDELTALLDDLGLLQGLKTSTVHFAAAMFNEYDKNDDGGGKNNMVDPSGVGQDVPTPARRGSPYRSDVPAPMYGGAYDVSTPRQAV